MKRKITKLLIIALSLFTLAGCVPKDKTVLVTSYPMEYLFKVLGGNRVNVERLYSGSTAQTAVIRSDYEELIKKADAVFYIDELQPYWEIYSDVLAQNTKIEKINLADRSTLYNFKRFSTINVGGKQHIVDSEYYESTVFEPIDTYDKDPFLWMDPLAMTSMARTIKDWLTSNYPDESNLFEERFNELEVQLINLQADYQKLRTNQGSYKVVTVHPSFGNWQRSFGVSVYPLILSKYGSLPTDEQFEAIRERIQADDVRYIAMEKGLTEEELIIFNQIKTELQLTEINLNSLFDLTSEDISKNMDYITEMYNNLEALESMNR